MAKLSVDGYITNATITVTDNLVTATIAGKVAQDSTGVTFNIGGSLLKNVNFKTGLTGAAFNINGSLLGKLTIKGDLALSGQFTVGQDLSGTLDITGNANCDIEIAGSMNDKAKLLAARFYGDVTIWGNFYGRIGDKNTANYDSEDLTPPILYVDANGSEVAGWVTKNNILSVVTDVAPGFEGAFKAILQVT